VLTDVNKDFNLDRTNEIMSDFSLRLVSVGYTVTLPRDVVWIHTSREFMLGNWEQPREPT